MVARVTSSSTPLTTTGYNVLRGFGGNDTIAGAGSFDTLFGGTGSDKFEYGSTDFVAGEWDTIQDFDKNPAGDYDGLNFYGMTAGQLAMQTTGGHTYITTTALAGGGVLNGGGVIVLNTTQAELAGHMFFL
jgi:Ca2+-binding RTX toxin-like protein